ncbi:MAG: type III-A CRISPR-associated protein Csm2 [Bacteroidales bacterium]|jgi:CRISPR-associated protein Csm2|nr:type III-A CRISPR-associated protein Csm2 [Bacteroidales bacterium]MCI2134262.1 type III-A CRISPR-associated protein Csm2 [Bacteroidales bacterium]
MYYDSSKNKSYYKGEKATSSPTSDSQQQDYSVTDENGNKLSFKDTWITNGADKDMIVFAKSAGKNLADAKLTSSKLRNIYGEIKRIQIGGYEKEKRAFLLLQPKVAYTVGREDQKNRKGVGIFQNIFDRASNYVSDANTYNNFCNLMEAIVAYHKFFGDK